MKSLYILFQLPPHLSSTSALPGKTGNPEIESFHLNTVRCFASKHKILKLSLHHSWTTLKMKHHLIAYFLSNILKILSKSVHVCWSYSKPKYDVFETQCNKMWFTSKPLEIRSLKLETKDVLPVSPAKTAEPIEMPFEFRTRVGPRNHVLDVGSDPPWKGAILKGKGRPIVKYRDTLQRRSPVWKQMNRSWCCLDCGLRKS